MTAIAALMVLQRPADAGPAGGTVVGGSASISQAGTVTNINQSSNKAIIDWQSFSVAPQETVNFYQPSSSSVTLNRVVGNETSVISGALNANGQVFIVNSAGVLFTRNAQVNVGGLVASTLDISNSDFMAGNYTFSGTSGASVINQGRIHARDGGYVSLLGKTVSNDGVIVATLGTVAMASGSKITLNLGGDSLIDVTIDKGTLNALVENKRAIIADGGKVIMTAKAADAVLSAQVNNSGIIRARTMAALKGASGASVKIGSIKIVADGGTAKISGKLDASAPKGGDGGTIETSGNKVQIADGTVITTKSAKGKTGTWIIDPDGFTIAASGGDITGATLSNLLASNNVEEDSTKGSGSDGNINVNDAVSWSANTTLTLNATNNININAPITATGDTAGLVLKYGGDYNIVTPATYSGAGAQAPAGVVYSSVTLSGANASLSINDNTYTLIHSMSDLAAITGTGYYALAQNLDATSGTPRTSAVVATLNGTLAGLGHTISNLSISNPGAQNLALIGQTTEGSVIRDIGLLNVNINAGSGSSAAALVGLNLANISKAYSTGTVTGNNSGGLIGWNVASAQPNTISDSFSDVTVTGSTIGGLIGRAEYVNIYRSHATGGLTSPGTAGGLIGSVSNVDVYDSYATGAVTGNSNASALGGLIGNVSGGVGPVVIRNSYATGNVTGGYELGGLVGMLNAASANFTIENSYATGNVTSSLDQPVFLNPGIGGLVGTATSDPPGTIFIKSSYATGNVRYTGSLGDYAGGLVGFMQGNADIEDSHATGTVTGSTGGRGAGGLVGTGSATNITNSYATGNVTGNLTVGGLVGGNSGTITNSHATGNVVGTGNNIGGLVGSNTGTGAITGSYATGSVTGLGANSSTGGLVGTNAGTIADSWAGGVVTGPSGLTGGIAGSSFNNSGDPNSTAGSITNSYYNSDINPGVPITNSLSCCDPGKVNGGGGLTNTQFKDVQFYANGTINQVLADRAAAAAAAAQFAAQAAAAAAAANVIATTNVQKSATTPPSAAMSTAGTQATSATASPTIADKITVTVPTPAEERRAIEEQRERRRAATTTMPRTPSQGGAGSRGPGFGATIRSIEIDGQRYDLQDDAPKNDAPKGDAPKDAAPGQPPQ